MPHARFSLNQQGLTNQESKPLILMMIKGGNIYKKANFRQNPRLQLWKESSQGQDIMKLRTS